MRVPSDASAKSLGAFVASSTAKGSVVHTDGWQGYNGLTRRPLPTAAYRGNRRAATRDGDGPELDSGALRDVLDNDRVTLMPIQRSDLHSGEIDERPVATLVWIARRHSVVITALN